jgi:hypothetical protein
MPTPRDRIRRPEQLVEHERLARLLPSDDREWLRRMSDVLEPGSVVSGMATRPREGVMPTAGGVILVRAPEGPSGASSAYAADPVILGDAVR